MSDGDTNLYEPWLSWAMEIQSIAQNGLTYAKDVYDIERYQRLRDISAEMIRHKTEIPLEKVKDLFCGETGYQTPKLDTRAAIFENDRILLVQEKNGTWSLPGGWVDVLESVVSNTVKEVREEAGLIVAAERIIAVLDRNRHNRPPYPYGVCKIFMLCRSLGGMFQDNSETLGTGYFDLDHLPRLAEEKCTVKQVKMCFDAYHDETWTILID